MKSASLNWKPALKFIAPLLFAAAFALVLPELLVQFGIVERMTADSPSAFRGRELAKPIFVLEILVSVICFVVSSWIVSGTKSTMRIYGTFLLIVFIPVQGLTIMLSMMAAFGK